MAVNIDGGVFYARRHSSFPSGGPIWLPPALTTDEKNYNLRAPAFERASQSKFVRLITQDGRVYGAAVRTASHEWTSPKARPRNLRFRRVVDVVAFDARSAEAVALLAFHPWRCRCPAHAAQKRHKDGPCPRGPDPCPKEHFESVRPPRLLCATCSEKDSWRCHRCAALNQCDDCDTLTGQQPFARVELHGAAGRREMTDTLYQWLMWEACAGKVVADKLHVAIDLELPPWASVLFQNDHIAQGWRMKLMRRNENGIDVVSGVTLGDGDVEIVIYDKLAEVAYRRAQGRQAERPPWTAGWSHVTRIELRVGGGKKDGLSAQQMLDKVQGIWSRFSVADLRHATPGTLPTTLAILAKVFGFISVPPTESGVQRRREQDAGPPPALALSVPVLSEFPPATSMPPPPTNEREVRPVSTWDLTHWALDALMRAPSGQASAVANAGALHDACFAELLRLSGISGIDLAAAYSASHHRLNQLFTFGTGSTGSTVEAQVYGTGAPTVPVPFSPPALHLFDLDPEDEPNVFDESDCWFDDDDP